MNVGDPAGLASIAPTAAGQPASASGVNWSVAPDGIYTLTPAADGMSAQVAPTGPGTGAVLTVIGVVAGVSLSESAALPDVAAVAPPPPPPALNLTVTFP